MGIEKIPNKNPNAWLAPLSPTISNAMGPRRQINSPSHIPMISVSAMRPSKLSEKGIHSVQIPSTKKASCCILILLTHGKSATLPHRIRETPDVIDRHMTKICPSDSGKVSLTCFTWGRYKNIHV